MLNLGVKHSHCPPCGPPCFVSIFRSKSRVIDHVSKQKKNFGTFAVFHIIEILLQKYILINAKQKIALLGEARRTGQTFESKGFESETDKGHLNK